VDLNVDILQSAERRPGILRRGGRVTRTSHDLPQNDDKYGDSNHMDNGSTS